MAGQQLQVVDWDDGGAAMDSVAYDAELLGSTADVETENAVCARLVPELCERADIAALHRLTSTLAEIPEHYLADIIFTTLSVADATCEEALEDMLRVPYTPATMTSVMRRRHLSDVTRLAEYITDRLQTTEAGLEPLLMDWLTVLMDSQYSSLVLSGGEEVSSLLDKVKLWRDRQELQARGFLVFLREMDQMKALGQDPPSPPAAAYCVETLHL